MQSHYNRFIDGEIEGFGGGAAGQQPNSAGLSGGLGGPQMNHQSVVKASGGK